MSWDQPVNQGFGSWNVIQGNKPHPLLSSAICNAVPGVTDWTTISAGQTVVALGMPLRRVLPVLPGLTDVEVPAVNIDCNLHFEYGSRYRGAGAFIRQCWIDVDPTDFVVAWGFEVWLTAQVGQVRNAGSRTAPVAELRIQVSGFVKTPKWQWNLERWRFELRGDGAIGTW